MQADNLAMPSSFAKTTITNSQASTWSLNAAQAHLRAFNKGKPPGFARNHSDGSFDLTQVLIHIMLDQVLDQGCLANTRRAVHNHYEWRGLFWGGVHHRNCRHSIAVTASSQTLSMLKSFARTML